MSATLTSARLAQQTERRTLILALLEEQPYHTAELASMINVHNGIASSVCRMLARDGCIARLHDWRWTFVSATGRARSKGATPGAGRPRLIVQPAAVPIAVVSPPAIGVGPTTRIIDGVEYEIVFDGRQETPEWPIAWASSLAGCARPEL